MLALALTRCLIVVKYLIDLSQFLHKENEDNTPSPPRVRAKSNKMTV